MTTHKYCVPQDELPGVANKAFDQVLRDILLPACDKELISFSASQIPFVLNLKEPDGDDLKRLDLIRNEVGKSEVGKVVKTPGAFLVFEEELMELAKKKDPTRGILSLSECRAIIAGEKYRASRELPTILKLQSVGLSFRGKTAGELLQQRACKGVTLHFQLLCFGEKGKQEAVAKVNDKRSHAEIGLSMRVRSPIRGGACAWEWTYINKWKNHFYEMKGDVGMSLHEKERNKKMPTPRHKVTHNPIPSSLFCFNMLFVCLL